MAYNITHEVHEGIERITYVPEMRKFDTPLLFQHGAFQGAWCWQWWQQAFANLGWISHAYSLPGHGNSQTKRPFRWCTQAYYRGFLQAEIKRCEQKPVVIAHSMGGGILQRYLKQNDDLPAVVMVGAMPAHGMFLDALRLSITDPLGTLLSTLTLTLKAQIRTPARAAYLFLDTGSQLSPTEFHKKLTNESLIAIMQHNTLMWKPPRNLKTPMLWLTGEVDVSFAKSHEKKSAEFYGATYYVVEGAAHNIMMAHNYRETADYIHDWLIKTGIN